MHEATLVEGANVTNGPKCNKGPKCNNTLSKNNNHFQIEIKIDLMTCDRDELRPGRKLTFITMNSHTILRFVYIYMQTSDRSHVFTLKAIYGN